MNAEGLFALAGPWAIAFGLILIRVAALVTTTPLFSMSTVPVPVRAGFVGCISLLVSMKTGPLPLGSDWLLLSGAALREAFIGGLMGLSIMLLFGALQLAGQIIGIQMGFAMANVMDPTTAQQVGVLSQVFRLLGLMLFLVLDGHLLLLEALFKSFEVAPLAGGISHGTDLLREMLSMGGRLFELGLQMALPVISTVLLVNTGLAVVARTIPQVNIFVLGFIFSISLGLLMLSLSIPSTALFFEELMQEALRGSFSVARGF